MRKFRHDPSDESTVGRYHREPDNTQYLPYHKDVHSHEWKRIQKMEERRRLRGVTVTKNCEGCDDKPGIKPPPVVDLDDQVKAKQLDIIGRFKQAAADSPPKDDGVKINEEG